MREGGRNGREVRDGRREVREGGRGGGGEGKGGERGGRGGKKKQHKTLNMFCVPFSQVLLQRTCGHLWEIRKEARLVTMETNLC